MDKLRGERPEIVVEKITKEEGVEEVQIKVTATINGGEIEDIVSNTEGAVLDESKTNTNVEKYFKVKKNGIYYFKAIGDNGRKTVGSVKVDNILELGEPILKEIEKIDKSGVKQIRVKGKTSEGKEETITYSMNVIKIKPENETNTLVLDGEAQVEGATLSDKVYSFGSAGDVGTANENAKNTVVLKVEGNLQINSGVTLTSVASTGGYGGPKGMIVYCTGELTNNGTISMTARGGKAVGENVYLWKNANDTYEYVPAVGATTVSGSSVTGNSAIRRGCGRRR